MGVYKTFHRIAERFYWPKMRHDIASYIRGCRSCIANKPEQKAPAGLMAGKSDIQRPWEQIYVDIVGPLPKSIHGYRYILSVMDYFSKFVLYFPLRHATSKNVCNLLVDHIFCMFGVPRILVCDNEKQFGGHEFRQLASKYNIRIYFTPLYHPQRNAVLRAYIEKDHRRCDEYLQKVACAIRSSKHESTQQSPYFINFAREIILAGDEHNPSNKDNSVNREKGFQKLYADVRKHLDAAFERHKTTYNMRRRDVRYTIGDKVWHRNYGKSKGADYITSKFLAKFVGPFSVRTVLNPWTYELQDDNGKSVGVWHAKDVKPDVT